MQLAVHPSEIDPELTDDRLNAVARFILDVYSEAISNTQHKYDNTYTQGSRGWAWVREAILEYENYFPWLKVVHRGNDIQFKIGSTSVFRFFCDDPESPQKRFVILPTAAEASNFTLPLFEGADSYEDPDGLWRFMIRKSLNEDDEHELYCVKYKSGLKEAIAKWQFNTAVKTFVSSDAEIPAAAKIPAPILEPRRELVDEDDVNETKKSNDDTI
ncbi:MAG: hypothetical protein ACQEXG_17240 [Pseudomonadota bacterium]